jgi:hypothetical protein
MDETEMVVPSSLSITDDFEELEESNSDATTPTTSSSRGITDTGSSSSSIMMPTPSSNISQTPSEKEHDRKIRMKAAGVNCIGTLINPLHADICPLAEARVTEMCYFKGYLKNTGNIHSDIYVKVEYGGRIKFIEIQNHILVFKKCILYFLYREFNVQGILDEVYNAVTTIDYFHVKSSAPLIHPQLAYLILKTKNESLNRELFNYMQKFPSNYKSMVKYNVSCIRMTMPWFTVVLFDNMKKAIKTR